jgi:hypothetical protein
MINIETLDRKKIGPETRKGEEEDEEKEEEEKNK